MFVGSDKLAFQDAHHLENLGLVCSQCHPNVEWGDIIIEPIFEALPEEQRSEFRKLWTEYMDDK